MIQRAAKVIFLTVGSAAAACAVLYLCAWIYVAQTERLAEKLWVETCGPSKEILQAFPTTRKNQAAANFEAVVQRVGIEITLVIRNHQSQLEERGLESLPLTIHEYLESVLENQNGEIPLPPPELARFLEAEKATLYEARELLLNGEFPVWAVNIDMVFEAIAPHFYSFSRIQEWLLADALLLQIKGASAEAARDLEAGWVLNRVILARPELQAQICAISVAGLQAGVLRKIEGAPEVWAGRMDAAIFQSSLERAFRYEAWLYREGGRRLAGVSFRKGSGREGLLWRTFGRLWYRLTLADLEKRMLNQICVLRRIGICSADGVQAVRESQPPAPWWETVGSFRLPNLGEAWSRLVRLKLDLEFTRAILAIKGASAASGGSWPLAIPDKAEATCPGLRWVYRPEPGGNPSLSAEASQALPPRQGTIDLPLAFRF